MSSKPRKDEADGPWKEALDAYFPSFLLFFWPEIHADIDWSRSYESLDKEFQKISRRAKSGRVYADKLFKVWLKDGEECWLLIHIEIQGDVESEFPRRMFTYNTAIWRLYGREVVSLAVLCDNNPSWKPSRFGYGRWGGNTEQRFLVVKLLDYEDRVEELEKSTNPISAVVLAQLKTKTTQKDPESRKLWKLRIVKGLYGRGWKREDIAKLLFVVDWLMSLPKNLDEAFEREMVQFEEEQKMPYVTSFERVGHKRGLKEGMEKGREEGMEKGREEGLEKGYLECIEMDLSELFGPSGRRMMPKVRALGSVEKLREFARFLKKAETLAEVRARLAE